ncbi:hypothetical protein MA16_Dca019093 [Dendrobium catenatum]|uniref:Uncharacterized protein n=1 Tax=Dendrobium catenatum TaxID=906689 RepID=A0A2I0WP87_9ASPA|nr:hypothetical protein MA16_Dca019093 [Dendrobium catenatum]
MPPFKKARKKFIKSASKHCGANLELSSLCHHDVAALKPAALRCQIYGAA